MPDITMCTQKGCDKADICYRKKAKPSYFQAYSDFKNSCTTTNRKMYWRVEGKIILEKRGRNK